MPSARITKTNIDRTTLAGMKAMAATEGISTTKLIDKMYLHYLEAIKAYGNSQKA